VGINRVGAAIVLPEDGSIQFPILCASRNIRRWKKSKNTILPSSHVVVKFSF
jgi:hypothetical protein